MPVLSIVWAWDAVWVVKKHVQWRCMELLKYTYHSLVIFHIWRALLFTVISIKAKLQNVRNTLLKVETLLCRTENLLHRSYKCYWNKIYEYQLNSEKKLKNIIFLIHNKPIIFIFGSQHKRNVSTVTCIIGNLIVFYYINIIIRNKTF